MRIKIVRNDGRPISISWAVLRYVTLIGPIIIFFTAFFVALEVLEYTPGGFNWPGALFVVLILSILLFPFLMITLGSKKQGLHDKIAKTYVVKIHPTEPLDIKAPAGNL